MAVASLVVTPLGTGSPSVSKYVAEVHKVIKEKGIKHQLTPADTVLEGEIDEIFETVKAIYKHMFEIGLKRVSMHIHIDERIDKKLSMEGKVGSVKEKLNE
ncbi:MAG: MTH1187 family thiamine-binding protein [Deltaproteobacteria bacterium]|nr:MTH1187 family thiamine-binding protein [Deltaproteobacteria bacterium]